MGNRNILSTPERDDWSCQMEKRRSVWQQKEILRDVYTTWYKRIQAACRPGRTLEIGSGGGHFKQYWRQIISSDITFAPWLDVQADCHRLPFLDNTLDNIVGVDVIHHFSDIDRAFQEMSRVLCPGGRLVFIEPFISPFSYMVRKLFHHEDLNMATDKLHGGDKLPDQGNDAMPTKVFWRERSRFTERFPYLRLIDLAISDPIVYPLTGGFGYRSVLPEGILEGMRKVEWMLRPLHRLMAFKMLIVAERLAQEEV